MWDARRRGTAFGEERSCRWGRSAELEWNGGCDRSQTSEDNVSRADKHKTFNIHNKLIEHDDSSNLDKIFTDSAKSGLFNERTSRKMIIKDLTINNQEWCNGAIFNPADFNESSEPVAFNAN